jgi:secreted PhoX family phosphatase
VATVDEIYEAVTVKDGDDVGANRSGNRPLLELARARMSRRTALKGFVTTALVGALGGTLTSRVALAASSLSFQSLPQTITEDMQVAPGYSAQVLIRWGDPVLSGAPAFDPLNQTAEAQAQQFGYNNDFLGYFPLPRGSDSSEHGLLAVNFEYTSQALMFPGWAKLEAGEGVAEDDRPDAILEASLAAQTPEQSAIEMMAHGGGVIEVIKENGQWRVVDDSQYARRITAETEMEIAGPAAGHDLLKTSADPAGTKVLGMLNNCAGGKTPWGTWLSAEENFNGFFGGSAPEGSPLADSYKRYGVPGGTYAWNRSVDRFDVAKEPNEPHRFGWMVEIDPYDPASVPVKRTGLGRLKHEGATTIVNPDGRLVVYMGDDERFDYLYRYVSNGTFDPAAGNANGALLDDGTLYVAKFDDDKLTWLPLVHGEGPLTAENGFPSQAEVLIHTRLASDAVGATPMDRPEDVEPNPVNGRVYLALTNNTRRKEEQIDGPNPRAENAHGQIIELVPPGEGAEADHAASEFSWNILLLAGNPAEEGSGAMYGEGSEAWLSSPDNIAIDPEGRLWISSDQGGAQATNNLPDGMYCCDVDGAGRAAVKFFFATPKGAEMCGPEFTPDGRTLFVAPQHPAEAEGFVSTFENPDTRWPDFADDMPPRPSIVVITKDDGGLIGS